MSPSSTLTKALCTVETSAAWLASVIADWREYWTIHEYGGQVTDPYTRLHAAIDEAEPLSDNDDLTAHLLHLRGLLHPTYYGEDGLGLVRGKPIAMPAGVTEVLAVITRHRLMLQRLKPRPVAPRMSVDQVVRKAKAILRRDGWPVHRGKPSKRRLADRVGCSPKTLDKALVESTALTKAFAACLQGAGLEGGDDEFSPELQALIAEQAEDDRSHFA